MTFPLEKPDLKEGLTLSQVLFSRSSTRRFAETPFEFRQLSYLMWSAGGPTEGGRRTIPSAGALYPLFFMAVIGAPPQGLPSPGQYRYRPENHSLDLHRPGDIRRELAEASLNQGFIAKAPAVIAVGASPRTTTYRYGSRGHRYVLMEAGHAGQNVSLMAESLGLGSVMIGAFEDDKLAALLNLAPEEEILYLIPVGPLTVP